MTNSGNAITYFVEVGVVGYLGGTISDIAQTFVSGTAVTSCFGTSTATGVLPNGQATFSSSFSSPVDTAKRTIIDWSELASLSPSSQIVPAAGSIGTVSVYKSCAWTALSNASWIVVTAGASGSTDGTVSFSVAANSGSTRTGTITIAGLTFTITQASPALQPEPHLAIDTPANGSTIGTETAFVVSGWALDKGAPSGIGIDTVAVYAFPTSGAAGTFLGFATQGGSRTDIGQLFGAPFANCGFTLSASGLPTAGQYQIAALGHSTVSNTYSGSASAFITVTAPVSRPAMSLDAPNSDVTVGKNVKVAGWAIDQGAATGTGVDSVAVYAYPASGAAPLFAGFATYGLARNDIGQVIGAQFKNSGYQLIAPVSPAGIYKIVAFAHSTVSGNYNAVSANNVTVNASASNATLFIDTPALNSTATRTFTVTGWTVDEGATTGTGVDNVALWAFPVSGAPATLVGLATYGLARGDIAQLLGDARFTNSGYSVTVASANLPAAGSYDLIVFGHSTVTNDWTVAKVRRVTVQ